MCSFGRQVVCGLWSPGFCGQPLVRFSGCVASVVPIWCGLVFSLSVDVICLGCSLEYTPTILLVVSL